MSMGNQLQKKTDIIDFGEVVVLSSIKIKGSANTLYYSLDGNEFLEEEVRQQGETLDLKGLVCRYLKIEGDIEFVSYEKGNGYIGVEDKNWTDLFVTEQGWMGGDGLFTYNLYENRSMNASKVRTLAVFGDTFVNTRSSKDSRLDPWSMPHNSYAIVEGTEPKKENTSFHVKQGKKGNYLSYLEPENALAYEGTVASNLVNYNNAYDIEPYLSSYNPKKPIEIIFKFGKPYFIEHIEIENYYREDPNAFGYSKRGIKKLSILCDGIKVLDAELKPASNRGEYTKIELNKECTSVTFIIPNVIGEGNHGGANGHEGLFGLNCVRFYTRDGMLIDVDAESNSEFSINSKHAWFWLQDGIIVNKTLYSFPLVGKSDLSQPEGFQFRIEGVSLISIPLLEDFYPDFDNVKQKSTNLYGQYGNIVYTYGGAVLDNLTEDGLIYVYGYLSDKDHTDKGKQMVVARTKDILNIDEYRFYDGNEFQKDITKAKPLLNNISCEFSVFKHHEKYVAIFTPNVQSRYVGYALADTPYGPFGPTRLAYKAPEFICKHQYDYNAKGHLHLSDDSSILVSYNVNTSNLEENLEYASTYGPRFIRFVYTEAK